MGHLIDFEAFRKRKLSEKETWDAEIILYDDLSGTPDHVTAGMPVTFKQWNLMPPWLKGLYRYPSA